MRVSYAQTIFTDEEKRAVNEVLDDPACQLAPGKRVRLFEEQMAAVFGKKYGTMVNSGSSANLLALYCMGKAGMEVLTPALTFGTTISPIYLFGMKPVFFDVDRETLQIDVPSVVKYLRRNPMRERIFMIPALMGNLPDLPELQKISQERILGNFDIRERSRHGLGVYIFFIVTSVKFWRWPFNFR